MAYNSLALKEVTDALGVYLHKTAHHFFFIQTIPYILPPLEGATPHQLRTWSQNALNDFVVFPLWCVICDSTLDYTDAKSLTSYLSHCRNLISFCDT